jgi:hypothetical protein
VGRGSRRVRRAEGCEIWLIGGEESDLALILECFWNWTACMALLGCDSGKTSEIFIQFGTYSGQED